MFRIYIFSKIYYRKINYFKIINDEKSIIEELTIYSGPKMAIYCSFEKIKNLNLYINNIDIYTFPLFNKKCCTIFKSLTDLSICSTDNFTDYNTIINLYNNIDNCKYLRKLVINLKNKEINEKYYNKYIDKLISLKISYLDFSIQKTTEWNYSSDIYSIDELKKITLNKIYPHYVYKITKFQD